MKLPWVLGVVSLTAFSACISHDETVYKDVERSKIEFETDAAARIFYETLSHSSKHGKGESNTEVALPFVFHHKRREVTGENVRFNDAILKCDTNGDGRITEQEARIFANQMKR
jgi:hypothetical protein